MATGLIGQRIAAYRRRRGLSQAALAGLIGRSESWLSQVERGLRNVDRWSVLTELAVVLRVPVEALTGSPEPVVRADIEPDGLDLVRQFFAHHAVLDVDGIYHPVQRPDFGDRVRAAHTLYQAARYDELIRKLPALMSDSEVVRRAGSGGLEDVASAYVVSAKLLTKIGLADLALLAADRSATVATSLGSVTARGSAGYQIACALLGVNRTRDAEELAVRMAEQTQQHARPSTPTIASVAGSLWLIAAVIAGRRGDRLEADHRLDQAQRLAADLGADENHAWTAFGPTNVAIHRVTVALGMGEARQAIQEAAQVQVDQLPIGLTSRRVQVNLDLAAAYTQQRSSADAVLHLLQAEHVSPESIRHNASAQQTVRELLKRTTQSTRPALHDLAVRAGVLN
jgi:transcriptional regulator with XRE-family HTH domain